MKRINSYVCVTSTQAFNEASNVWFVKYGWNGHKIREHLDNISLVCEDVMQVGRGTINKAICVYHKVEDIYELPQAILSIRDDYRFALRQHYHGFCDTVLYAL